MFRFWTFFFYIKSSLKLYFKIWNKDFIYIFFIAFIWISLMHSSWQCLVHSTWHFWKAFLYFIFCHYGLFWASFYTDQYGPLFMYIGKKSHNIMVLSHNIILSHNISMVSYIVNRERQGPPGNNSKTRLSSLTLLFFCSKMFLQNQGSLREVNRNGQTWKKKSYKK